MGNPRYIEVPAARLLEELRTIGKAIEVKGGKVTEGRAGREVVFDFAPPESAAFVRVYTSLAVGATTVRACGADAIRIGVASIHGGKFRSLAKPVKMLRTAPKGTMEVRLGAFMERFKDKLRDAYRTALNVPKCPYCKGPMAERSNKATGSSFYGCLAYPECKGTRRTT